MRWSDMAADEPRLAEMGCRRLEQPGVVLVGTIRRDGSPRISPVEPLFWEGDLWLSMMLGSLKARDLRRDPRILVHSVVDNRDGAAGEFKVRGRAIEESSPVVQQAYATVFRDHTGLDSEPIPGRFHLFRIDIDDVAYVRYDESTGDQFTTLWPDKREFVRRGTSPTTVGEPEPHHELLDGR